MECIFPNLYHFSGTPRKGETSHTYILKRNEGNLFVCHHSGLSAEDIDEIEGDVPILVEIAQAPNRYLGTGNRRRNLVSGNKQRNLPWAS